MKARVFASIRELEVDAKIVMVVDFASTRDKEALSEIVEVVWSMCAQETKKVDATIVALKKEIQ